MLARIDINSYNEKARLPLFSGFSRGAAARCAAGLQLWAF
jgi:hypothetical protein